MTCKTNQQPNYGVNARKVIWNLFNASVLLLFCLACTSKPKAPTIAISLVNGNRSLKIKGFDQAIAAEIGRDTATGIWETLLPVYRMPADTDLKNYQPIQHGSYLLKDSVVVFTPDTPFVKGQAYFMRYYQFGESNSAWDFIQGRKTPGSVHYVDLVF